LWLLSKESFEEKLLAEQAEKWGKLTRRKKVGEKLFEDLTNWRAKLTKDFKKNNNVDEDALDEGVQKVLDRMIFIRTTEDRKIEPNILLSILREWGTAGKKRSIYKKLTDAFRRFDDDYNSKLFASHALEEWKASDKIIEEIIKGLYQTADGYRYDFSAISTDVLGGIYEQYLGYVQEKAQKDDKSKKSKRKSQGIYYTPKYIVEYLMEQTLSEVLKKAKKKDLSNIKILDPACGSGSFLIAAFDKILEAKNKLEMQTGLFDKFDILQNNIYGVDLDEQAIEIAQLNLLLRVLSQKTKLPTLSHNIRMGNSLVDGNMEKLEPYFKNAWREQKAFIWKQEFSEVFDQEGFSVIIGNPPYVFARGKSFSNSIKKYFYDNYELANYQLNTYLLFIDRAYKLLKHGGYFGFIVPNTWLTIDTCLLIFKKGRRSKITLGEFKDGKLNIVGKFSPNMFKDNNHIINIELAKDKDKMMILKKVNEKSKQLNQYTTVKAGLKSYETGKGTPLQTDEMKNNRVYHSKEKIDKSYIKYLEGRDVMRYQLGWSGQYLKYGNCLAAPRKKELFTEPRILVRQIPSLPPRAINGIYTDEFLLNDINSMIIYDFQNIPPLFILAVLNSKLTTFWFANTFDKFQRKTFPQFKVKELAIFPIPEANEKQQIEIAKLSQLMLDLQKELQQAMVNTDKHARLKAEIERLDAKIDQTIYKLYELTNEEIATIEK